MFPIICKIGPLSLYSYGLMLAVAVIVCSFLMSREAKPLGIAPEVIFDFVFWVIFIGLLGARFFYILLNVSFFIKNPLEIIMIQRGGIAWQGSLIAGTLSAVVFIRRKKLPLLTIFDLVAPYIALGQAIGRIGCFLNGCCYGKPSPHGIYFPVHADRLYPTQLFCSLGLLIIFLILRFNRQKFKIPGQLFISYLVLASTLRFVIEFFRGDHDQTFLGLSVYQWMSLAILSIGLGIYSRWRRHTP